MTDRLRRERALLVIIDVQEKLMPVIHDGAEVVTNIERLIRGCALLGVPVIHTEQYPQGLGATLPSIEAALHESAPHHESGTTPGQAIQKMTFSAAGSEEFVFVLKASGRTEILVCGVETHVCVWQTVLDLQSMQYGVTVIGDAVSSRTPRNRDLAIDRMSAEGAVLSTTEMALFELTGRSGTDEFRGISRLVK